MSGIVDFVRESNRIEGITRDPTLDEIAAHERLLALFEVHVPTLNNFQSVIAPGHPLRNREGLDVHVGHYVAPPGHPKLRGRLERICRLANCGADPWLIHCKFELLHPYMDGNGRTGRALWMWQTHSLGRNPFALPFLQAFYYQTLEHSR
jgi:Fic family protein